MNQPMPDESQDAPDAFEQAESKLFEDALCYMEVLPVQFKPQEFEESVTDQALDRAESLLRMMAQLEESYVEDTDDRANADLHRIEAKLQLTLELIGALVAQSAPILPTHKVRWSRRGVSFEQSKTFTEGTTGLINLQPVPWLPHLLSLPCQVLASREGDGAFTLWLAFEPLPQSLETAIERHLFRRHRRSIAASARRSTKS